ncbi:MAG: hypothetical protein HYS98_08785 [Deltaproteobacteria bacterium]|nr:hypothetical protein [Deltaproteobacteria bacterium]
MTKNLKDLALPEKYLKEGLLLLKTELDSAPYLEQSFEESFSEGLRISDFLLLFRDSLSFSCPINLLK